MPLAPASGDRQTELSINLSDLADQCPPRPEPFYSATPNCVLVRLADSTRVSIARGTEINVDLRGNPVDHARLFSLNIGLGLLLRQRGHLILHATAIEIEGRGIAIAGPSGSGKSVIAARAAQRGFPILTDETCVLGQGDQTGSIVLGPPVIQLWRDAIEQLRIDPGAPVRPELQRYFVSIENLNRRAVPLRRLYVLGVARSDRPELTKLKGRQKLETLVAQIHHPEYLSGMGLAVNTFRQCMELAPRLEVFRFDRPEEFRSIDEILDHATDTD